MRRKKERTSIELVFPIYQLCGCRRKRRSWVIGTNGCGVSLHDLMEKLGNASLWSLLAAAYLVLVPFLSLVFLLVDAEHRRQNTELLSYCSQSLRFILNAFICSLICIHILKIFSCHLLLQSSLLAHLELPCTSPRLDELSHCRLDWQLALAPTLLSHFLPAPLSCTPLLGQRCQGTVWPGRGFTRSILCSLYRGQLSRVRCADAKQRTWRQPRGLLLKSNVHGVTFPCRHSAERLSSTLGGLLTPSVLWSKFFFFLLYLGVYFKRNHFFGDETGIFPHIMHINGFQRLSG